MGSNKSRGAREEREREREKRARANNKESSRDETIVCCVSGRIWPGLAGSRRIVVAAV
jgi:hypothetical protein